jgi:hypothetical protein
VPENPGALTLAIQKGAIHDDLLRDWLASIPDDVGGRWWRCGWEKAGRVLARRNEERVRKAREHLRQANDCLEEVLGELTGDEPAPADAPPPAATADDLLADLV